MTTHIIIPDPHAHPEFSNERAEWVGELIHDIKPDVVINIGDMWDLASMSTFDKGKGSFHGKTFKKDIDAGLDFDEKLWHRVRRAKKKKPHAVFLEGNHEFRLKRAIENSPELDGVIGFNDFDLNRNYGDIVEYSGNTPGVYEIDGVNYAHFFTSGVMGRPISGEHPAYSLLTKQYSSCTCGHIHVADWATRTNPHGKRIMGLVAGVYQDYDSPWAGEINKLWWRGVVIKRNVEDGCYDPEFVSLERLRNAYGKKR